MTREAAVFQALQHAEQLMAECTMTSDDATQFAAEAFALDPDWLLGLLWQKLSAADAARLELEAARREILATAIARAPRLRQLHDRVPDDSGHTRVPRKTL